MLPQNDFRELFILSDKSDVVTQDTEKTVLIKEPFDLLLKVPRLFVSPVEEISALKVPSNAVIEVNEMGHIEDLRQCHHLRRLPMVPTHLLDALVDAVRL